MLNRAAVPCPSAYPSPPPAIVETLPSGLMRRTRCASPASATRYAVDARRYPEWIEKLAENVSPSRTAERPLPARTATRATHPASSACSRAGSMKRHQTTVAAAPTSASAASVSHRRRRDLPRSGRRSECGASGLVLSVTFSWSGHKGLQLSAVSCRGLSALMRSRQSPVVRPTSSPCATGKIVRETIPSP